MATKENLRSSIKKLHGEIFSLTPSTLVTFFEIDLTDLLFDNNIIAVIQPENEDERIFRFHNNVSLSDSNLIWQGKNYQAIPIKAENFEMNSRGTLPIPKLSITVNEEGISTLALLKAKIKALGDIVGAKVTRKRTLLKFLDAENTFDDIDITPNIDPDSNAHFPNDIFYIERKSQENKTIIEYELASLLDVENVQLPNRPVLNSRCPFQYRGEGCLYEYENLGANPPLSRRVNEVHGTDSTLPNNAPPVANEKDELIVDILAQTEDYVTTTFVDLGLWDNENNYTVGDSVYVEKDGLKYYFVCRRDVVGIPPPDTRYWIHDKCSKTIDGCKFRWGTLPDGETISAGKQSNAHQGCLPFGGFAGTNKAQTVTSLF